MVIGGGGLIGKALCARLVADGHEVTSVDVRESPALAWETARADILRDDLTPHLEGAAAVVHLVARVDPPHPARRRAMRRLHVEGAQRVVAAVERAGVPRLVLASSAVVYGAWPDAPSPLTEDAPVRPLPSFPYAVDKAEQERVVSQARASTAYARLAMVYGRGARTFLVELVKRSPGLMPAVDGKQPPLQLVHPQDAARALAALARSRAEGPFNVASEGVVSLAAFAEGAGRRLISIPGRWVAPVLDAGAWVVPRSMRAPSYLLDHLRYPWVMSTARIERELGVFPDWTGSAALREVFARGR